MSAIEQTAAPSAPPTWKIKMKYLSICSGIEAASAAWHHMGWKPAGFAEIEPFPAAVLAHHFPDVHNFGDMTKFKEWNIEQIDLLVGGTPCQAFSVAGLRGGLSDARGNLTLTFVEMADHFNPEWIVWENVPGVLSSQDNAFGCFLAGLVGASEPLIPDGRWDNAGVVSGPKRTAAWRVLDAQYFGVAQRRRRVFVCAVRGAGNWAAARAFFPIGESVYRDSPPRREAREGVAGAAKAGLDVSCIGTLTAGFGKLGAPEVDAYTAIPASKIYERHDQDGRVKEITVAPTQHAKQDNGCDLPIVLQPITFGAQISAPQTDVNLVQTLQAKNPMAVALPAYTFRSDAMREGTAKTPSADAEGRVRLRDPGMGMYEEVAPTIDCGAAHGVAQPIHYRKSRRAQSTEDHETWVEDEATNTLNCFDVGDVRAVDVVAQPVAFHNRQDPDVSGDISHPIGAQDNGMGVMQAMAFEPGSIARNAGPAGESPLVPTLRRAMGDNQPAVRLAMQVRRLTPTECERLQGFPDGWTNIPWRGKPEAPDGPRYKALGNSMAVPCMRWIGERIQLVQNGRV